MEIAAQLLVEKLDHTAARYSVLPRPIDWMIRVKRPSIQANIGPEAA
jgi:hypothetical protein